MRSHLSVHVVRANFSSILLRKCGILAIRSSCATPTMVRRLNSTSSQSPPIMSVNEYKYDWIDGAESLEKYRPGGYHSVMIGDRLHQRYRIVEKLGFGGYSTIWLGLDTQLRQYVAIKICIADAHPSETSVLKVLSSPSSSSHPGQKLIPLPLGELQIDGPNGAHTCYAMTPARCNLREVSFSHLFPLDVARALSGGLTMAVAYTHSRGFVHGDIHLQNVLVKLPSRFDQFQLGNYMKNTVTPRQSPLPNATNSHFQPTFQPRLLCLFILAKLQRSFLYRMRKSFSVILVRHFRQGTKNDWDKTAIPPWLCNPQKLDLHHSLLSPTQRISGV